MHTYLKGGGHVSLMCMPALRWQYSNAITFVYRNAEKELVSQPTELEPGQEWERIAKLCDFNPKASRNSKDVSRMRSIILQLKQSPPISSIGQ